MIPSRDNTFGVRRIRRRTVAGCATSLPARGGTMSAVLALLVCGWAASRAVAAPAPSFEEVSGLVRSNLAGATPEMLDGLAVDGFLKELAPRVVLVDSADARVRSEGSTNVTGTRVYRSTVGYIDLGDLAPEGGTAVRSAYEALAGSNRLTGLVLDLRESGGDDYAAALGVVNEFLSSEVPLVNWGDGLKRSTEKPSAIVLPVVALIGEGTGGAGEALAAMLRQSGVALLIGRTTAGTAGIQQAFPLDNGQFLRITVANIQLGDAQVLTPSGLKPDVTVQARAATEPDGASGAGAAIPTAEGDGTNSIVMRSRLNEADLVRRWRGEIISETEVSGTASGDLSETRDPVLLRALDLMEGLAILRSWQK